jgi:flavin-dependent dehydrogenase
MYDAVVVGARCAGASTAILLARKGHRVLLVDRSTFPSDMRLSNHLVWQPGIAQLRRWGLLEKLVDTGCPGITTASIDVGPFTLTGRIPGCDGVAEAYAPRRKVLDGVLLEAATRSGVDLWEGCAVEALLVDDCGRVSGIRGRSRGGRTVTAEAAIVVGADGMRSSIARMVAAPTYLERPARRGIYFTYWSGVPVDEVKLYSRPYRSVVTFPTHDDLTVVSVNWVIDDYRAVRRDIASHYFAAVSQIAPELAERLRTATREERWIGTTTPGYFRRPYGPGWALVGDAGYLKDPCTARGITDAFEHAELLAGAIHDGLTRRRPFEVALAAYERRRNDAVMPMYEFTDATAGLQPPTPQSQALFASFLEDRALFERFLGVFAGTVPVQAFFPVPAPQQAA